MAPSVILVLAGTLALGTSAAEPVRIGYLNVMDDAPTMVAYDAGLYAQEGLDPTLQLFGSGTDLIKGLVTGDLDVGVLGFTNALAWVARGADLRIVGGAQMGYHAIVVRKDSGIRRVEDLKGRSLATQKQGSTADVVLNGVTLAQAGLTRQDLQMVYVSPAVAVQSLVAGRVDAAFLFEPYDRIARLTAPVEPIYEIGQVWPFPCMVVITSGKAWKERRPVIEAVLAAQRRAIELLESAPDQAAALVAHRFIPGSTLETPAGPVPATQVIREAIETQTFTWRITPDQSSRMKEIAGLMQDQGILAEPVDVEKVLDLSWQEGQEG
ncbi:ABC transporter substrate-binding protein [Limnochorda pilosa]|uniref:ABC transporter substrate-binding protein n=1 Tax=Limnochorda pilosa TaxID=1555112 RepID=A0A0K2SHU4_LIMPI|nr:ABC transporter substrate-binding protein [Limnochorda pilosa]